MKLFSQGAIIYVMVEKKADMQLLLGISCFQCALTQIMLSGTFIDGLFAGKLKQHICIAKQVGDWQWGLPVGGGGGWEEGLLKRCCKILKGNRRLVGMTGNVCVW